LSEFQRKWRISAGLNDEMPIFAYICLSERAEIAGEIALYGGKPMISNNIVRFDPVAAYRQIAATARQIMVTERFFAATARQNGLSDRPAGCGVAPPCGLAYL
jgi:hypothetical protein